MKKLLSIVVILSILVSVNSSVFAFNKNRVSDEMKIESIIDEMNKVTVQINKAGKLGLSEKAYVKEYDKLEDQLFKLGVVELSKKDIKENFNVEFNNCELDSSIKSLGDVPSYDDTNETHFYGSGPYTSGSSTCYYIYSTLITEASPLHVGAIDVALVNSSYDFTMFMEDALEIYAFKMLGTVKFVRWLPYEALTNLNNDKADVNSYGGMTTEYCSNSSMKHCFVYDSGSGEYVYEGVAQKVYFSSTCTVGYYVDGDSLKRYDHEDDYSTQTSSNYYTIFQKCLGSSSFIDDYIYNFKFKFNGVVEQTVYPGHVSNFGQY